MAGQQPDANPPMSGAIPVGAGLASVVRIPIPGSAGLAIELRPRGYKGAGTSTLFFHDVTGKRHLRLDYGYNKSTKTIDYHWNQRGVSETFKIAQINSAGFAEKVGIKNHTPVGRAGEVLYKSARYFRYLGRFLVVAGGTMDAISIVKASNRLKRATEVTAAWAGAWVGCKVVGAGGAAGGTFVGGPIGTAVGGIGGCIVGGVGGYMAGEEAGRLVYEWAENTRFLPVEEVRP